MEKQTSRSKPIVRPRLIIHGGAGNITPGNLPPKSWMAYREGLVRIYKSTNEWLQRGESALDAATHAVSLFEDCELFNCGKGAVFTRDGTNELEASVMTTQGYHKRACAVAMLKHVKNPIKLAQEMLVRGQHDGDDQSDLEGSLGDSEGAQGHVYLGGNTAERLATQWGLEMVEQEYFWTKKRWQQHRRGLKKRHDQNGGDDVLVRDEIRTDNTGLNDGGDWDGIEYLPQGTTGCVALDQYGTICVATSTGGMTNKLPFRIGDTPTIGAGFWAEQWNEAPLEGQLPPKPLRNMRKLSNRLGAIFGGCLSRSGSERLLSSGSFEETERTKPRDDNLHAIAVSGTGNGDSFLKLSAARTVGAIVRFSYPALPPRTLASAFNQIVGQGGEMQRSAGHNWGKTGEGEGGMIGIELKDRESTICWEFNCGGMFRCWGDCHGSIHVGAFEEDEMMGRELQSSGH